MHLLCVAASLLVDLPVPSFGVQTKLTECASSKHIHTHQSSPSLAVEWTSFLTATDHQDNHMNKLSNKSSATLCTLSFQNVLMDRQCARLIGKPRSFTMVEGESPRHFAFQHCAEAARLTVSFRVTKYQTRRDLQAVSLRQNRVCRQSSPEVL